MTAQRKLQQVIGIFKERRIAVWGIGRRFFSALLPVLEASGLVNNVEWLIDCSADKIGTDVSLSGRTITVYGPDILRGQTDNTIIIAAPVDYQTIRKEVQEKDYLNDVEMIAGAVLTESWYDLCLMNVKKPPEDYRRFQDQKIPKKIHTFWFSSDPIPVEYENCMGTWRRFCPDYEIIVWNLKTYTADDCLYYSQAVQQRQWAFASDYARADIVFREGGIYMDMDVEVVRPLDDLLYNEAYMGFENMEYVECGSGFGAVAGSIIIGEIRDVYKTIPFILPDGEQDRTTCPKRYSEVLWKHGLRKNGGFQLLENVTVFPFESLTAKSFGSGHIYRTKHTYTIHHHKGSWLPIDAGMRRDARYDLMKEYLDDGDALP